jgi:hypothetical protein
MVCAMGMMNRFEPRVVVGGDGGGFGGTDGLLLQLPKQ